MYVRTYLRFLFFAGALFLGRPLLDLPFPTIFNPATAAAIGNALSPPLAIDSGTPIVFNSVLGFWPVTFSARSIPRIVASDNPNVPTAAMPRRGLLNVFLNARPIPRKSPPCCALRGNEPMPRCLATGIVEKRRTGPISFFAWAGVMRAPPC